MRRCLVTNRSVGFLQSYLTNVLINEVDQSKLDLLKVGAPLPISAIVFRKQPSIFRVGGICIRKNTSGGKLCSAGTSEIILSKNWFRYSVICRTDATRVF